MSVWLTDPVRRLRLVGMAEGVSYLLLLGIAVPLKHLAGIPEPVMVVGWAHGVLFMVFCVCLLIAKVAADLTWSLAILVFIAAVLPFGPFVVDSRLRRTDTKNRFEAMGRGSIIENCKD